MIKPPVTLIEVRDAAGDLVTEQGATLYQALGSTYRGTYEQMRLVYGDIHIKWVGVLAAASPGDTLLFRHAVTGIWADIATTVSQCEPRSLLCDVNYMLNTLNALIHRLEEEHPDFRLIGNVSQAHYWLEQVLWALHFATGCGAGGVTMTCLVCLMGIGLAVWMLWDVFTEHRP